MVIPLFTEEPHTVAIVEDGFVIFLRTIWPRLPLLSRAVDTSVIFVKNLGIFVICY